MLELNYNDNSNLVSLLQITLKELNLYNGNIDRVFGDKTLQAVKDFQSEQNITVTGIVNEDTWNKLLPYINVPTTISFDYDVLTVVLNSLTYKFPFIETGNIGTSVMGNDIPYIKLGIGAKKVLYVASTHANEWITTPILMKFIEDYSLAYLENSSLYEIDIKNLYTEASIYIVPMLNPDGVNLVTNNISKNSTYYINATNIANRFPNIRFPAGWKANINGIDLNLQFPAEWEKAKELKFSQGYTSYAPRDFVGNFPLEAPEAIAIYDFSMNNAFDLMLTYHSQGEVIFWKFLDYNPPNSQIIGEKLSNLSGYPLQSTPISSSYAGLKDWFIQFFNLPAYTFEVGRGTNPLPISEFDNIYKNNLGVLITAPTLI